MEKNGSAGSPRRRSVGIDLVVVGLIIFGILSYSVNAQEQKKISTADLSDAQKLAEKFLELVKTKGYEKMKRLWHMPVDYNQFQIEEEEESMNEVMEIYNEVLGDLQEYSYKSYEWQDSQLWSSGKIDLAELILTYESKYTKYPIDTRITIVKDGDNLKVSSYGISSPISLDDVHIYMEINEKVQNLIKTKKGVK